MFTGIIPATGKVMSMENTKRGRFITIKVDPKIARKVPEGGSVSVNGVCLTRIPFRHPEERSHEGSRTNVRSSHTREILRFAQNDKSFLQFELMDSTLKLTTLGTLKIGDRVNVELAMRASDMVGGHFVSGHVDGVGVMKRIQKKRQTGYVEIALSHDLMRYVVSQGSIAVNGVSLTVVEVTRRYTRLRDVTRGYKNSFSISLTSYTIQHTNLGDLQVGGKVNIEVDMFAKYIYKFINHYGAYQKVSHRRGQV